MIRDSSAASARVSSCRRHIKCTRAGARDLRRARSRAIKCGLLAGVIFSVVAVMALVGGGIGSAVAARKSSASSATTSATTARRTRAAISYPVGTADGASPSGEAPPSASALPGYKLAYTNDFDGSALPAGWQVFTGVPGSDPGTHWAASHVVVGNGMLQLNAWQDPAFGHEWVTGGVCQCTTARKYGAFFVRSRITGSGPTQVELLWPSVGWPPEIDFDETYGGDSYSMATTHYSPDNLEIHRTINIDMEQWHTWGVIWTPTSITYTVDGSVWGSVSTPAAIPSVPMSLHIQQQTWCSSNFACPTAPASSQIDWVAEYVPAPTRTIALHPFVQGSAALSPTVKRQVANLAKTMAATGENLVALSGTCSEPQTSTNTVALTLSRARSVRRLLSHELSALNIPNVTIDVINPVATVTTSTNATPAKLACSDEIVATAS